MYKKKINVRFMNKKINLNHALSTFNSQNTTWHISLLLNVSVTCNMRCTDIWRSLIALKIMQFNNLNILFHGPSVFQKKSS